MPYKPYNKPDPQMPRTKTNCLRILNQAFFNKYREKYPNTTLTNSQIRSVILNFHKQCIKQIITTRDGVELHDGLGYVFLGSCNRKYKPCDTPRSLKLGQEVHNQNWHTNEWLCKICYTNYATKYRFKNAAFWGFEPSRALSRGGSKEYIKNHKLYVITDNFRKLNKLFKRQNQKFWENNREIVHMNLVEQRAEQKLKEEQQ